MFVKNINTPKRTPQVKREETLVMVTVKVRDKGKGFVGLEGLEKQKDSVIEIKGD